MERYSSTASLGKTNVKLFKKKLITGKIGVSIWSKQILWHSVNKKNQVEEGIYREAGKW